MCCCQQPRRMVLPYEGTNHGGWFASEKEISGAVLSSFQQERSSAHVREEFGNLREKTAQMDHVGVCVIGVSD